MSFIAQENSRASLLLAYVTDQMTEVGHGIDYATTADIVGVDLLAHGDYISSVLSGIIDEVNKRLHRNGDWRHLINIPKVGYRIASPAEHREENLGRLRAADGQVIRALRVTEKSIRHPDATVAERTRAANAAAAQGALLQMFRREARKVRNAWPAEEVSPVLETESLVD